MQKKTYTGLHISGSPTRLEQPLSYSCITPTREQRPAYHVCRFLLSEDQNTQIVADSRGGERHPPESRQILTFIFARSGQLISGHDPGYGHLVGDHTDTKNHHVSRRQGVNDYKSPPLAVRRGFRPVPSLSNRDGRAATKGVIAVCRGRL